MQDGPGVLRAFTGGARLVMAFFIAPFAPAALAFLTAAPDWADALLSALAAAIVSFTILLVAGIPLLAMLRYARGLRVQIIVPLSGLCGALITPVVMALLSSPNSSGHFNYQNSAAGLVYGASIAAVFCAIAGIGFKEYEFPVGEDAKRS